MIVGIPLLSRRRQDRPHSLHLQLLTRWGRLARSDAKICSYAEARWSTSEGGQVLPDFGERRTTTDERGWAWRGTISLTQEKGPPEGRAFHSRINGWPRRHAMKL